MSGVIDMYAEKLKCIGNGKSLYISRIFQILQFEASGMCRMKMKLFSFLNRCPALILKRSDGWFTNEKMLVLQVLVCGFVLNLSHSHDGLVFFSIATVILDVCHTLDCEAHQKS